MQSEKYDGCYVKGGKASNKAGRHKQFREKLRRPAGFCNQEHDRPKNRLQIVSSIALLPGSCYNIKNSKLHENDRVFE